MPDAPAQNPCQSLDPPRAATDPGTEPSLNAWQILALPLTAYASEPNPAQSRYAPARRAAPRTRPPAWTASQKPASGHLTAIFRQFLGVWYDAPMNTITNDSEPSRPWLFKPGNNANPRGRPPGTVGGRTRALQILDEVSNREDNAALLAQAMDAAMKKNPLAFFLKYMAPLLPKQALLRVENNASHCGPWVSMVEVMRYREIERRAKEAGLELPPPIPRAQRLRPGDDPQLTD